MISGKQQIMDGQINRCILLIYNITEAFNWKAVKYTTTNLPIAKFPPLVPLTLPTQLSRREVSLSFSSFAESSDLEPLFSKLLERLLP